MRADCMRLVQLRTKMLFMGRQIICSVDTWGRQTRGSGEGDGSFVPTLHTAQGDTGEKGTFDCWFDHYWSVLQGMF